jgi:ribonuclease HIII
MTRGV